MTKSEQQMTKELAAVIRVVPLDDLTRSPFDLPSESIEGSERIAQAVIAHLKTRKGYNAVLQEQTND